MEQLEKRFYDLDELAQVTGVKRKSNNFKRDVRNTLEKWCYRDCWIDRKGTNIIEVPTTPEERLQEILVRQFHVDIQVNMYDFSCFITAFDEIDGFRSMPWESRADVFKTHYDIEVTERTLRKWCSTLLGEEMMSKGNGGSFWKTEYKDNEKVQSSVPEEEYNIYYKRRSELLTHIEDYTMDILHMNPELTYLKARREAWKQVYSFLWSEFDSCYYSCKDFQFKSWIENGELKEVIALAKEIRNKKQEASAVQ